jgi:hypothetical protein
MDEKSQSTVRLGLWLTFGAFLLIVFVFKNQISEIHFGSEGMSAKMVNAQDVSKLSPEDRKNVEQEMSQRLSTLKEQASSQPQPAPQANPEAQNTGSYLQPSFPNLAGYWSSPGGLAYQVNQQGNFVAISEVNAGIVQAVATGQIYGWGFQLPSYNLAGRSGILSLQVAQDQRHMTGQYQDVLTGATIPMQLYR